MSALRGHEISRIQAQVQKPVSLKDLKKYRDAAPQIVSDDTLSELIERLHGNDTAIFAAIEDMWHGISDERAVQGNEWQKSERKSKKKTEMLPPGQSDRSGRGRGKSAPPRGGYVGGRGGGGRGISSGRGDRSEGRGPRVRPPPPAPPQDIPTEWGDAGAIVYETENEEAVPIEETVETVQQPFREQSYIPPRQPISTKPAWSAGGMNFAQQIKLKEEQQKQAAILARQQQALRQESALQEEVVAVEAPESDSALEDNSGRSRSKRNNRGRSNSFSDENEPDDDDYTPVEEENNTLEILEPETEINESEPAPDPVSAPSPPEQESNQMDLSSLSGAINQLGSPVQPTEEQPVSVTTSAQHIENVVAAAAATSATSPPIVDVSQLTPEQQQILENSPKPYLKLGKWEAPVETDRSAFQFGSFGSFADDTSSSAAAAAAWGVTEPLTDNLSPDDSSMTTGVWSAVGVSAESNMSTAAAQNQPSESAMHQLEDSSRFVDSKALEMDMSKQQSLQRPQGGGMPRKVEMDSATKSQQVQPPPQQQQQQPQQIQQQQLQQQQQQQYQQQQFQQQQQPQSQPANGAPPGLQHTSQAGMGATGGRGGMQPQGQGQVPYYGLDMGYMHPGYAPVTSPVAAVGGAVTASTTQATGTAPSHTTATTGSLQQQQQQPYPTPPPGMAAMAPYGASPYSPYFYNQPGYYYGNASAPNFYGRGGQAMYQPPRGPYVSEPYPQTMGGALYPTDMYGQPALTGQFGDAPYGGGMGVHGGQGGHQGGGPGAVGGSGKGGKGPSGSGGSSQIPSSQEHGHGGAGYGYGNPNPYSHNSRDAQAAAAQQWSYPQQSPGWNQQMMQQQQFHSNAPGGGSAGGGFSQQSAMSQGRHDGPASRGSGSNAGGYGQSYGGGNRGSVSSGSGAQGGGNHQPTW
mmetsp:Transcript_21623/g.21755  ORF Transcript_21623/g.21755 Transcript_21623/m.21755 type:complete len:916 (-) Transcript_21623:134-2881(-)